MSQIYAKTSRENDFQGKGWRFLCISYLFSSWDKVSLCVPWTHDSLASHCCYFSCIPPWLSTFFKKEQLIYFLFYVCGYCVCMHIRAPCACMPVEASRGCQTPWTGGMAFLICHVSVGSQVLLTTEPSQLTIWIAATTTEERTVILTINLGQSYLYPTPFSPSLFNLNLHLALKSIIVGT